MISLLGSVETTPASSDAADPPPQREANASPAGPEIPVPAPPIAPSPPVEAAASDPPIESAPPSDPAPAEAAPPIEPAPPISGPSPAVRAVGGADPWGADAQLGPAIEVHGTSGGLGLVAAPAAPVAAPIELPVADLVRDEARLKELLDLDDFTGALEVAEKLLQSDADHILALKGQKICRETLEQMYRSKIGDFNAVPGVLVSPEEVIWLDLDHRSGFLLAQVDGASSFDEIIELSGMDVLESLQIMAGLIQKGVIGKR